MAIIRKMRCRSEYTIWGQEVGWGWFGGRDWENTKKRKTKKIKN